MNILLIYPECPQTFWSYTHALWFIDKKAVAPPLGLLTVAALLPVQWGKRLVDLNVTTLTNRDLSWADYVFISGMSIQREAARRLIARCKAAGKKVVGGGPLFTAEYAMFQGVDHFILNEAELTLPPFLADLERGCPQRLYRTREFADLSVSPTPRWELVDLKQYAYMGIQYSRGCPYDCDFCNVTALLGRRPRLKSGKQITAELEALHQAGWREPLFFVDDNLIGDRPAVRHDLLPALIAWQKSHGPVSLMTQVSINLADDPQLMQIMAKAGFDAVFVGIETPDADSLAECRKNHNQHRDLVGDIARLHRAGLEVQGGFILGFDHDTPASFQRMIDFIQHSGVVTAMVGLLQSAPGTRLHQRLGNEGRLLGLSTGDNADGTTNIAVRMGVEELRQGYAGVLKQIYSPRLYYQRIRTFLRAYRPPTTWGMFRSGRLRPLLRVVYRMGIVGGARAEFWKLMVWTILRHPLLIVPALRKAVCGLHYRKVLENRVLPNIAAQLVTPPTELEAAALPESALRGLALGFADQR